MTQIECPKCRATGSMSAMWAMARHWRIAAFVCFWIGLIAMLIFGLLGMARLGGSMWLACTAAPLVAFLVEHRRRSHDFAYQRGRQCSHCGHRWVATAEVRLPSRTDVARAQV